MRNYLWLAFLLISFGLAGQSFEIHGLQETYKGAIGEIIKAPVRFKNTSDKPILLVIRETSAQIGSTQKNFFCPDNHCLEKRVEEYSIKIEPNQVFSSLQIALEAGLAHGTSLIRYTAFNKSNPAESIEFELNFQVEEKINKQSIYNSNEITLHDFYPIPIVGDAFVDYKILSERVKAKIVIHNILGSMIDEYPLPALENTIKIRTDALNTGIYFYTLYIDNEGVMTRKLIVRK